MKLVTYELNDESAIGAIKEGSLIVPLTAVAPNMLTLISKGEEGLMKADQYLLVDRPTIPLENVDLLAPIPVPLRNIMCLGKNYAAHAAETQRAWGDKTELPDYPLVFNKATTTANGPYDDIPYDASISTAIDYEAELAIVIGRTVKNISRSEAMDVIFGYMVINDITARDMQRRHKQFFKGKSLDGHAPMGPGITPTDA